MAVQDDSSGGGSRGSRETIGVGGETMGGETIGGETIGGETIGGGGGTIGGETIGGGGGGTRDASTEEEANRKEKNQKRKRNDEYLPRKKKCPAVHGRDNKEMWCKPCIQSKKCTKYI